ncbi:MAG TPA: phosphoenolpyruvate carboxylase [Streptosporangiaceae bacterium]|nr:phosphoenolpyruvate carboxylase [Streptosporangiaceae bacterium]
MPEPLRRDVRLLSSLLGDVLAEYAGQDLLDDVERLRLAVISARHGETRIEEVAELVESWSLERAELVARAFTVYFHLVNLAEEHHRIRTLRERDTGAEPLRESVAAAVAEIRATSGADRLHELLGGLELHPVFTAHPTEARRRAVVTSILRISGLLGRTYDPRLGASEQAETRRRLMEEIDLLWRTAHRRHTHMDPLDEVRTAMAMFDETVFRAVPAIYQAVDVVLAPEAGARPPLTRAYVRFGSWIGADRDGNPHVTAQVTREAITIQADHVLRALENACTRIGRTLTAHETTTPPTPALLGALAAARAVSPELLAGIAKRSPGEPHRQLLLFAAERIRATRLRHADLAYSGAPDLLADLHLVQESLIAAGAVRQAYGELQHLIWQAETFGFHLAELEIRQHSQVHRQALAEIRGGPGPYGEQTEEVLDTLRVVGWIQERFGVAACRRYVVSFTRSADDIAAVHELAAHAAIGGRAPVLDVVPLFETGEDLDRAPAVLENMLALPAVRRRLEESGRRLEVMLGYSDSAKQLGPATATLRLYDAQAALAAWAAGHDVRLTLFHGRGGALGRGGGPAGRAVLAQAPGSVAGRFKVTEQGEVIFARYGHIEIARRHFEQVSNAVLLASTPAVEERARQAADRFRPLADRLSTAAHAAFRALVETPGFAEWFARVSPLEEISRLRIGSRPSRRTATRDLADLRAIPWVFAWTQTRVNLPGWYGLGSGLAAVPDLDRLRAAYESWPLFASLLDNAEMSLAKTDRAIAERYLALGGRPELTSMVLAEYDLTRTLVLSVTGHDRLLANRRVLTRAVELRNPYVDALSHLQLRALTALRAGVDDEAERERLDNLLLLSVNGVAAGLQNTG